MEMLRVRDVAAILRVTPRQVYGMAAKRQLPHTRIGSRVVFPRDAFMAWVAAKNTEARELCHVGASHAA